MNKLLNTAVVSLLLVSGSAWASCQDEDSHTGFCWDHYNHCKQTCVNDHADDEFKYGVCVKKCELEYGPKLIAYLNQLSVR